MSEFDNKYVFPTSLGRQRTRPTRRSRGRRSCRKILPALATEGEESRELLSWYA